VNEKVYIIDEDETSLVELHTFLSKRGFRVESENDPGTALSRLREEPDEFDVLLVEERMREVDGLEVLRHLQSLSSKCCTVVMSKEPRLSAAISLMQEGAFTYLRKPVNHFQLEDDIQRGLENRRALIEILDLSDELKRANKVLEERKRRLTREKAFLKRKNQELNFLSQLSMDIASTLDPYTIIDGAILNLLSNVVAFEAATLLFSYGSETFLRIYSQQSSTEKAPWMERLKCRAIERYAKRTGRELTEKDISVSFVEIDGIYNKETAIRFRGKGARDVSLPLAVGGECLGLMTFRRFSSGARRHGSSRLLKTVGNQLAVALKNALEHKRVQSLASTDGLTGLYNRRAFVEHMEKEFQRAIRYRKPLSLVMVDIDDFKWINDHLGHQAGDQVIKDLACCLFDFIRKADILARYGGDEFAVVLPETPAKEATVLAERLRRMVEKRPFSLSKETLWLTISLGVASLAEVRGSGKDSLINQADSALYLAKKDGRNSVQTVGGG
jgi:diguanylate cyclase (GGDEF)-like protein